MEVVPAAAVVDFEMPVVGHSITAERSHGISLRTNRRNRFIRIGLCSSVNKSLLDYPSVRAKKLIKTMGPPSGKARLDDSSPWVLFSLMASGCLNKLLMANQN